VKKNEEWMREKDEKKEEKFNNSKSKWRSEQQEIIACVHCVTRPNETKWRL
jgi:hypothetical protein